MSLRHLTLCLAAPLALLSGSALAQEASDAGAETQVAAPETAAPTSGAPGARPLRRRRLSIILHTDKYSLDIGGMGQLLGLGQVVDDPYTPNTRVYLFLPKATLRFDGSYSRFSFNLQVAMGGEDSVNGTSGIDFGLLDLAFNIPLTSDGKTYSEGRPVPRSLRPRAAHRSGFQDFGDVSMEEIGFVVGRDVGLALVSKPGPFTLIGGVFTGGGRDVPPDHYLPERSRDSRARGARWHRRPRRRPLLPAGEQSPSRPDPLPVSRQRALHPRFDRRPFDDPQREVGRQVDPHRQQLESLHRQGRSGQLQPGRLLAGRRRRRGPLAARRPLVLRGRSPVRLRRLLQRLWDHHHRRSPSPGFPDL